MKVVNLSHTIVILRSRQWRSLVAQVSVTKCSKNKLTSSMEKVLRIPANVLWKALTKLKKF